MKSAGHDPGPRGVESQFQGLMDRAHAMRDQSQQTIIELNAIRARVQLVLQRAEQAVLRANVHLVRATDRLIAARKYDGEHCRRSG